MVLAYLHWRARPCRATRGQAGTMGVGQQVAPALLLLCAGKTRMQRRHDLLRPAHRHLIQPVPCASLE